MAYLWLENEHRSMEEHIRKWVYITINLLISFLFFNY